MKLKLFFFCLLLVFTHKTFAQNPVPYCDSTCLPQSPWTPQTTSFSLPNCPQCTIYVWYQERLNTCDSLYEIIVEDFAWEGNGCNDCVDQYYPSSSLAWYINNYIIAHNSFTDQIPNGQCRVDISSVFYSCYRKVQIIGTQNNYHIEPCAQTTCCTYYYRICRDIQGNINPFPPEIIGVLSPPIVLCSQECNIYCQGNQPPPPTKLKIDQYKQNLIIEKFNISVVDNIFTLEFLSEDSKDFNFILSNLRGETISIANIKSNKGFNKININTDDLLNGFYVYKIILNNEILQSGKLTLIK
jgi:hypothetical protein